MTSSQSASSRGPLNPAAVRRSMCLVLIIRMQSAVRASLLRIASLRSSPSWASMDMGRKRRPKTDGPQRPPVNPGHDSPPKDQAPVLYFRSLARRSFGAALAKSTLGVLAMQQTRVSGFVLALTISLSAVAGGTARAEDPIAGPTVNAEMPPPPPEAAPPPAPAPAPPPPAAAPAPAPAP